MSTHQSIKEKSGRRKNNSQILPMIMIGAGLILLSGLAWIVLPKPNETAKQADSPESYESVTPFSVDYPAPELTLTDLQGDPVALSDYLGQVVLVNNWAIWCPPCKAEMPVLQAYYDDHKRQGFTIIGVESGEPRDEVAAFVGQYRLTFPIWPDLTQKALIAFRNNSLPSSYVIDRTGQVRLAWTGAISRAMLEKYVTPIVED